MNKIYICNLCGNTFEGWGNNPYPLCKEEEIGEARCCDECNMTKVIPARLANLYRSNE